jgi:hypothetical protein
MSSSPQGLAALDPILGRWKSSGTVLDAHGSVETHVDGTDTYRSLPGGHWIAHDVDVVIGGEQMLAHELIGGEHPDGGWLMVAFDESSQPGTMRLSLSEPDLLLLEGEGVRSWFRFTAGDDHMTTLWERLHEGEWIAWMDMRFDRMANP